MKKQDDAQIRRRIIYAVVEIAAALFPLLTPSDKTPAVILLTVVMSIRWLLEPETKQTINNFFEIAYLITVCSTMLMCLFLIFCTRYGIVEEVGYAFTCPEDVAFFGGMTISYEQLLSITMPLLIAIISGDLLWFWFKNIPLPNFIKRLLGRKAKQDGEGNLKKKENKR